MDNGVHTSVFTKRKKKNGLPAVLRGIIAGAAAFALSMFILPLLLSKTDTPEKFIATAAVMTVSLTCFSGAFAANFRNPDGFLAAGAVCALSVIFILVILSLVFGNSSEDKNYLFPAVLYISCFIFSLLGSKLSMAKKNRKRRKR